MLVLLLAHLVAALVAPSLVRRLGLRAFYLLATVPAAGLGWALTHTRQMRDGDAIADGVTAHCNPPLALSAVWGQPCRRVLLRFACA
jgi:hypothetical protein